MNFYFHNQSSNNLSIEALRNPRLLDLFPAAALVLMVVMMRIKLDLSELTAE